MQGKKLIITHLVAILLGLVGGFLGKDLTPLQKPVEQAVTQAVDGTRPVMQVGSTNVFEAAKPVDAGVAATK